MLSKSEIPGKHKPRKQLPVRSVSCPSAGQSLKTVAPEPVKKDKSKASKIPKKQSPRSQIRSCGRWLPLRLHDHFSYPRLLHPNWGCESLASDDIISSLLVSYSQLWEYVDTNPSTSEKLAPTKVVEWMCGLSETVPIVLRYLNTGGVALLEEVRHSLGQGRVQATVCFLCIPFSLCSLLAVQLVSSQWLLTSTLSCRDGLLSLWNPHAK